jgi:hypothetical protein
MKNKKSKLLYFGNRVAVLNDFIYHTGGVYQDVPKLDFKPIYMCVWRTTEYATV